MTPYRPRFPWVRPNSWWAALGPGAKAALILGSCLLFVYFLVFRIDPRNLASYQESMGRACQAAYGRATTAQESTAVDVTHLTIPGGRRRGTLTEPLSCGEVKARGWIDSLATMGPPRH